MGIIWWSGGIMLSVTTSKYSAQEGNSCVPDDKGVHLWRIVAGVKLG